MTALVDISTLITSSPEINGGRPCLAGTGTSVQGIAVLHRLGFSAEAIAAELPEFEEKYVYAALAYYFANRAAIDARIEFDEIENQRLAVDESGARRA